MILSYHGRLRSSISTRPQSANCAACHQCISVCGLPNQLLNVSPVSCGGIEPEHWIAVRYCESTTRRSSSFARGSVLPEKSIAAPVLQNFFQCSAASLNMSPLELPLDKVSELAAK